MSRKQQKLEVEVEFEKDDPKTVYLELFDKNTELKSLADEIQNISSEKDLQLMKCDKDNYKSAEPLYRERRQLLLEIPEFWSTVFTNLFLEMGFVDELTMCVDDFFVEDTDTEFRLYFDFRENDIIANKQVIVTVQTPVTQEQLQQEIKISVTPLEFKKRETKKEEKKEGEDNDDDEEDDNMAGFLQFLQEPSKDMCTLIVGTIWTDPIESFKNDHPELDGILETSDDE